MGNSIVKFIINPEPGGPNRYLIREGCLGFNDNEIDAIFRAPFWIPSTEVATLSQAQAWIDQTIRGRGEGPFYALIANNGMANDPGTGAPLQVYLLCPDITRDGRDVPNYDFLAGTHSWLAQFLEARQFRVGDDACARPAAGTRLRVNNYSIRRDLFFVDNYSDRYLDYPSGCRGACDAVPHPFNTRNYNNYRKKNRFFYLYRINRGRFSGPRRDILNADNYPRAGRGGIISANGAYRMEVRGNQFGIYGTRFIVGLGSAVSRVRLESDKLNAYIAPGPTEEYLAWSIKVSNETMNGPYALVLQNDGRLLAFNRFNKNVTATELAELNKGIAPGADSGAADGDSGEFVDYTLESEYQRRLRNLMAYLEIRGLLIRLAHTGADAALVLDGADESALKDVAFLGEYDSSKDYTRRLEQLRRSLKND